MRLKACCEPTLTPAEPLSKKPASRKLMTSPSRPLRTSTSPRDDLRRQRLLQFFSEFNQVAVVVLVGRHDDGNKFRNFN
jgi:hypothetical protein